MHRRTKIFSILLASLSVLALGACGKRESVQAASAGQGRPPAPVVVSAAQQMNVPVQINAIGNVEPYQTVQIRSQVNGQIDSVHFKEGDFVERGQLLFTLDKRPFKAALDQAMGNLKRDQAQAANAKAEATRYTELENAGVISKEQADQQRTMAEANASAVYADEAAVEAAKVQLDYTDIYSPMDARAGALLINVGNLVKANDTPYLVQLNQVTPIYVTFSVPETQLDAVRKYAADHLKVLAFPKGSKGQPSAASLTFIDNTVDPQTGMVKLKATSANGDRRLWPGEFVDVLLNLSMVNNAVVIPTKAVQQGQKGDYVYVVTAESTAESRQVETGGTYQNLTIIAKGINPGDRVIVEGQLKVAPNGKVVVQSTVPANTAEAANQAPNAVSGGGQ